MKNLLIYLYARALRPLSIFIYAMILSALIPSIALATDYTDAGTNTMYTLNAGDTLTLTGGTYTGGINGFDSSATITIQNSATFSPAWFNNPSGTMVIDSGGTAAFSHITFNAITINNAGIVNFTASLNFNGAAIINNGTGAEMNFAQTFQMGNGTNATNDGVMNFAGDFNTGTGSILTNNGQIYSAEFNPDGTFTNNGLVESSKFININGNANVINNCSFISSNGFNNNGNTFQNLGIIFDQGNDRELQFNRPTYNGPDALIRGMNFSNSADVTGGGSYWFSGFTAHQGGNFGIDGDGDIITFYDDTQTGSQIFDVQSGPVGDSTQVIRASFPPIDINYARTNCNSSGIVSTAQEDHSDAPTGYGDTTHAIVSGIQMGALIDSESAPIASTNADADGTDDDGVTLPTFTQGSSATIAVDVSQATPGSGYLQGWVDWNGDGDFADSGEQIASDLQFVSANSGTINVAVSVPTTASTSQTFARFRWSTASGLNSTTVASDGEVEDYTLIVSALTVPGPIAPPASPDVPFAACQAADFSGVSPDGLPDLTFPKGYWAASYYEGYSGTPGSPYATPASGSGGTGAAIYHGEAFWGTGENPVTITTNGTASFNRWSTSETPTDPLQPPGYVGTNWSGTSSRYQIDYRRTIELPGVLSFGLSSAELVDDILDVYVNGVRAYAYWPSGGAPNARPGQGVNAVIPVDAGDEVLIRFVNLGFIGGLTFYLNIPGVDCSDAPGSYLDASHVEHFGSRVYLGANLDDETSSILSADATGDGADDDGVTFPTLAVGNSASIPVVVNQAAANDGYLQGWIDWNGDGDFADVGEQIATDIQSAAAGSSTINVPVIVPTTATTNETFARFRWSTDAGLDSTTAASDGEVEDYAITIIELDYGDAPGYADAVHVINGTTYLGNMPDADSGTLTTNGDASDDAFDDGVQRNGNTLQDQTLSNNSATTLSVTTAGSGRLHGWIDWDGDGVFGNNPNERIMSETASASGTRNIVVTPPNNLTPGVSYARFRYSTDAAAANPAGTASDGEVEDYRIILNSGYNISGRVFNDTNVNSSNDSTEAGIAGLTVVLYNSANATCTSTQTNANGGYAFNDVVTSDYQVYEAAGETVPVPQSCNPASAADPSGYLSTTYNTSAVFTVSNSNLGGINFGHIQPPVFELDNEQTILPNSAALHPHVFTAQSDGSVSFGVAAENANPTSLNWGIQLLLDANCDGQLNSANGDSALPASINVSAGQQVCILAKVVSPSNTSAGAMHVIDIQSDFAYGDGLTGIASNTQTHQDVTRSLAGTTTAPPVAPVVDPVGKPDPVRGEGKLALAKSVWNVTRNIDGNVALPGETLRYTISYQNIGNGPLNELMINDNVPAFTAVVQGSMLCTDTPPELPACTTNENPDGSLSWQWTVNDELLPGSSGSVSYQVTIE